jgi:hypothetical protein
MSIGFVSAAIGVAAWAFGHDPRCPCVAALRRPPPAAAAGRAGLSFSSKLFHHVFSCF